MKIVLSKWLFLTLSLFLGVAQAHEVKLTDILEAYRPLHVALVNDDQDKALDKTKESAKAIQELASDWLADNPDDAQVPNVRSINIGAAKIATAADFDEARVSFVTLSLGTIAVIRADDALKANWQLFFCPMVAKKQGYWVQPMGEALANPFMGHSMPGCGTKKPW